MEIVLGKTAGFCYGVKRAVEGVKQELGENKKIYCLGEIVHNKSVIEDLEKKGTIFIEDVLNANGKTVIRAHGVTKEIYSKLKQKNIEIKDLTCPNVLKIHNIVSKYNQKGYFIVLVGIKNHPESIGTISFCEDKSYLLQDKEEINDLLEKIKNEKNILAIAQTTYNAKKFDEIVKILKESNPDKNIEVKKTICQATLIRQQETEKISNKVDVMLIIGDKKSSNTNKLYDISKQNCNRVYFVQNEKEIEQINLENVKKIGIMAGASTPDEDIKQVINKLENINKQGES